MLAERELAEWIFVDDGSTDNSRKILDDVLSNRRQVGNESTRVLAHPKNRGRAAARNTGIESARGEVLVFLDADAAPQESFLRELRRSIEKEGVVAVIGHLRYERDQGEEDAYGRYLRSSRRGPTQRHANQPTPWKYFLTTAAAVRSDALAEAGGFEESISYGEDMELAARLSRIYPDGLRYAPGAVVEQYDLGSLETALSKMNEFGRDNLPAMVSRHAELAQWTGVDLVDSPSAPFWRKLGIRMLLRPTATKAIHSIVPYLPARLSNLAVRYLLGSMLATSYKEGSKALSTR